VPVVDSGQPSTQRRRSERILKSLPLIVRGIDLLGQPFEERTSTLALNLHGCRYSSKHHLPKNTWVTLELPQRPDRRNVRARVTWIQRPHSVRELFQIAVELESPANIWSLDSTPADWEEGALSTRLSANLRDDDATSAGVSEGAEAPAAFPAVVERTGAVAATTFPDSVFNLHSSPEPMPVQGADSPLLREWNAEIERQAKLAAEVAAEHAAEQARRKIEAFERTQAAAREDFTAQLLSKQEEILGGLKSALQQNLVPIHELLDELEQRARTLRAESETALQAVNRVEEARLQLEAADVAPSRQPAEPSEEETAAGESMAAGWRQRIESEMAMAQAQWNELLQSSLDGGIERLVETLSARAQDILRSAELKMSERFAELREPLGQMAAEARATLASVKSALEQEVARARSSLAEIEHSSNRMKEYSAQLEAASHDTLNELHRRLENILAAQTAEMNRRVEDLAADLPQRLVPTLDSVGQQFVGRTIVDVESKIAPLIERVPELLRELGAREVQVEESLRLHRERLRQVSENNQREMTAQMAAELVNLRDDFESARKEALAKWNEELDSGGIRASHAAAESIGRSSEWFQQEARARLQVLVEQTLTGSGNTLNEKTTEAARQFEARLDQQSSDKLGRMREQGDSLAVEITGRVRTQLGAAAEAAAASFGQVLLGISEQEIEQFTASTHTTVKEREQDLERAAKLVLQNLEASAETSIDQFRAQMASHFEATVTESRGALAVEFTSALDGYRVERDTQQKQWVETVERLSEDAAGKYQERLETACDSWLVSSVRRLNEHGQNAVESLIRSADQALRDSCSKVFEGLAETLRDRATNALGVVGFAPGTVLETPETPGPHNQSAAGGSTA
jgi:hypothetical protein